MRPHTRKGRLRAAELGRRAAAQATFLANLSTWRERAATVRRTFDLAPLLALLIGALALINGVLLSANATAALFAGIAAGVLTLVLLPRVEVERLADLVRGGKPCARGLPLWRRAVLGFALVTSALPAVAAPPGPPASQGQAALVSQRQAFGQFYFRYMAAREAAKRMNPRVSGLYTGLSNTPTLSATPCTTSDIANGAWTPKSPSGGLTTFTPFFAPSGGWLNYSASYVYPLSTTKSPAQVAAFGNSGVAYQTSPRLIFYDTAPDLCLKLKHSSPFNVTVLIDGQYTNVGGYSFTAANTDNYIRFTFTTGRSAPGRRIEIVCNGGGIDGVANVGVLSFGGVFQSAIESIWPATLQELKIVEGDSYTHGVDPEAGAVNNDGYCPVWADVSGLDNVQCAGVSGSGILQRGSSGATSALSERLFDVTSANPALLIIRMCGNDANNEGSVNTPGGQVVSVANVQAAFAADLRAIRAAKPNLPIIVDGCFAGVSVNFRTKTPLYEAALQAAVAAVADPMIVFVPATTASPQLVAGNGYTTAPTGAGPSDWIIGSDATHPVKAGHLYIGMRMADDITGALRQIAINLGLTPLSAVDTRDLPRVPANDNAVIADRRAA